MNTIYIGVDFHARQQTICYLKTETGEVVTLELRHQDKEKVRVFYAEFRGHVIVGLEASGYSPWFERMLEELTDPAPCAFASRSSAYRFAISCSSRSLA